MIVHDFLTGAWTELHPGQPYDTPRGRRRNPQVVEPLSHVTIVEARPKPYDWAATPLTARNRRARATDRETSDHGALALRLRTGIVQGKEWRHLLPDYTELDPTDADGYVIEVIG